MYKNVSLRIVTIIVIPVGIVLPGQKDFAKHGIEDGHPLG